jgi:hypothetical protein
MLREIFLWCLGRLEATRRENERKIAISQRAAHLLLLHLCKLPIASIDLSDPLKEDFYTTQAPDRIDDIRQTMRYAVLARAAEHMVTEVADELLNGRRFLNRRLPDRSLLGFCDGNGNILGSEAEIIGHAKHACDKILVDKSTHNQFFFLEIVGKRIVSHYHMAIVHLGAALVKQPVVIGEQACQELIEDCIRRGPVNSLKLYCPCHTDPMKPAFDKAMLEHR